MRSAKSTIRSASLARPSHTIILVTHEPDIAQHAWRTIFIRDGKVESDKKNR
jgi:macrolide transport system ATP-binding/permease protein